MSNSNLPQPESKDNKQENKDSLSAAEKKKLKLEKERTILLSRLGECNLEDVRTRVAFVLNQYPKTRDSDIALTIKYWSLFNSDLIGSDHVSFLNLYRLPKTTSISRARAKIQNEYGLYQASEAVAGRRAELESKQRDSQVEDKPADSKISIYCDESGKGAQYNIVGSLWIYDGYRYFKLSREFSEWKNDRKIEKELHFKNLKARDQGIVKEFIEKVVGQSDMLSFKAVVLDSGGTQQMSIEELNFRLHYQLVVKGIEHEIETGRFSLPRNISLIKDKDVGADKLRLTELEQRLTTECQGYFSQKIKVEEVRAEESHASFFIQLADLFAASINRKLNSPGSKYKDELADMILRLLGVADVKKNQDSLQDFATILWL